MISDEPSAEELAASREVDLSAEVGGRQFVRPMPVYSTEEKLELKRLELELLEKKAALHDGLPHLYAYQERWYKWAREFFDSTAKECFLTAANQSSKSSTQIRKMIDWATDKDKWEKLWRPDVLVGGVPNQFWYLYPTSDVATIEFEEKWVPLFMPRGEYKDHPVYGWVATYERNKIKSVSFNSGVTLYFKTYAQNVSDLQTGTVYYMAADEELPVELLSELQARVNATDGYFSMVFTATLGQQHWKDTIEPLTASQEKHVGAFKRQVSLFDCLFYDDGSKSHWTRERINRIIAKCPTKAEVDRRVHGKFVKTDGLLVQGFDRERNVKPPHPLNGWLIYSGIDPGSGGEKGHPAAIAFVAVSRDYKHGRIFRVWRGDGIATTSTDILEKYRELREKMKPVVQRYDYAAKDFFMVASRQEETFTPADKDRSSGFGLLNTLFKTGMLQIFEDPSALDSEIGKLIAEIGSVPAVGDKRAFADDLIDAVRYAINGIPFDFSDIKLRVDEFKRKEEKTVVRDQLYERRYKHLGTDEGPSDIVQDELDYWNEMAGE
jgi:phage terminase large subunit-like protein